MMAKTRSQQQSDPMAKEPEPTKARARKPAPAKEPASTKLASNKPGRPKAAPKAAPSKAAPIDTEPGEQLSAEPSEPLKPSRAKAAPKAAPSKPAPAEPELSDESSAEPSEPLKPSRAKAGPKAATQKPVPLKQTPAEPELNEPVQSEPSPADSNPIEPTSQTSSPAKVSPIKSALTEPNTNRELFDFDKFKPLKVINESSLSKFITLQGTYKGETAVIRLEKTRINDKDIKRALKEDIGSYRDFINDIYSSYTLSPSQVDNAINNLRATLIWPANQTVIAKYTHEEHIIFSETPDTYLKVVEPFISDKTEREPDYNQWVYNILEGRSEIDRVIFNDTDKASGFMLVLDLKWTGDIRDLSLLAICHRRDIRSLRDLNDKHLVLLQNILTQGTKAIKDKYKKLNGQLRSYIHYQPSYYHFHVHFKVIDASDYQATDRDNLLSTVINNITLMSDYYKKSTLTYPLSQSNALYHVLKKAGRVRA